MNWEKNNSVSPIRKSLEAEKLLTKFHKTVTGSVKTEKFRNCKR